MVKCPDNPRWVPRHNGICRHVTGDYRTGPNNRAFSNGNARQYAYLLTNPNPVANAHRLCYQRAILRRHRRRTKGIRSLIIAMIMVSNEHATGNKHLVTDLDTLNYTNVHMIIQLHIVAEDQTWQGVFTKDIETGTYPAGKTLSPAYVALTPNVGRSTNKARAREGNYRKRQIQAQPQCSKNAVTMECFNKNAHDAVAATLWL